MNSWEESSKEVFVYIVLTQQAGSIEAPLIQISKIQIYHTLILPVTRYRSKSWRRQLYAAIDFPSTSDDLRCTLHEWSLEGEVLYLYNRESRSCLAIGSKWSQRGVWKTTTTRNQRLSNRCLKEQMYWGTLCVNCQVKLRNRIWTETLQLLHQISNC